MSTATLSLKEVPGETHRALKERAQRNHRSLNGEILAILEAAVVSQRIEAVTVIRRAEALRARFDGRVTEIELSAAKRAGRE